jgi:serine/threonine-protein kinase
MHMAPEQAKNAKAADTRSDIWSLGATLYHALSGEPPWPPEMQGSDLIVEIGTGKPTHLQDKAPWVPKPLAEVVHRALKLDPAERWESVAAMREALEAAVEVSPVKLTDLGPLSSSLRQRVAERAEPPEPESHPPPPPEPAAPVEVAPAPQAAQLPAAATPPPTLADPDRKQAASRATWIVLVALGLLAALAALGYALW